VRPQKKLSRPAAVIENRPVNADRIREARDAQPFSLRLADGTTYHVTHRDFLFIPPVRHPRDVMFSAVLPDDDERYTTHWIELGLIALLELLLCPANPR
jgi:hypothetical protein